MQFKYHLYSFGYIAKKTDSTEEKAKVLPLRSLGSAMRSCGEEIGDSSYGEVLKDNLIF